MMSRFVLAAVLATILVSTSIGYGQSQVVGWRGDGTGRYDDAKPLLEWSSSKNVAWRTPMDNWTNSTPVVVGDRIFTQAEPSTLICVSASNGKVLWEHMLRYEDVFTKAELAQFQKMREEAAPVKAEIDKLSAEIRALRRGANRRSPDARKKIGELRKKLQPLEDKYRSLDMLSMPETHGVNGYTSPTPVSDGKHVYVLFSTGVAACYDMDGKRIWAWFIEKPNHVWGIAHRRCRLTMCSSYRCNGTTLVLEPGREYKEVGRNKLEEFRSTPVFVGTRMYVRTRKHLYCIGPE